MVEKYLPAAPGGHMTVIKVLARLAALEDLRAFLDIG